MGETLWARMVSEITSDTKLVNPNEINSFWALLHSKWKSKIVGRNLGSAGRRAKHRFLLHRRIGPGFLRSLLTEIDIASSKKHGRPPMGVALMARRYGIRVGLPQAVAER